MGDAGLTGRKIIVDTYGGMGRHGGGAFSGKDPHEGRPLRCLRSPLGCQERRRRGSRRPLRDSDCVRHRRCASRVSLLVETFGTAHVDEEKIEKAVSEVFDLRPGAILRDLDLQRPIYSQDRCIRPLRPRGLPLGADQPRRRAQGRLRPVVALDNADEASGTRAGASRFVSENGKAACTWRQS